MDVNGKQVRGRRYPWGVAEGKLEHTFKEIFLFYPVSNYANNHKHLN